MWYIMILSRIGMLSKAPADHKWCAAIKLTSFVDFMYRLATIEYIYQTILTYQQHPKVFSRTEKTKGQDSQPSG